MARRALFVTLAALVVAACGKKGPPLAPLRPVPSAVTELTARRLGGQVQLRFTLPTTNTDSRGPADLDRVEVYGFTGNPVDELGKSLDNRRLRRLATLVATLDVKPPASEEEAPVARTPADLPDQGSGVTVVDTLTPDAFVPIDLTKGVRKKDQAAAIANAPRARPGPLLVPVPPDTRSRLYLVMGLSHHGDVGAVARVSVSLANAPSAPQSANACYSETEICVEWTPPAVPPPSVQQPAAGDQLPATPLLVPRPPSIAYNVYEVTRSEDGTVNPVAKPLNGGPLATPPHRVPNKEFGGERCFVVTSVTRINDDLRVESAVSPPACVTLNDIFPPVPPRGLAAVGSAGAISLIWEANTDADIGGYLVLRGEAPGETLQPLMDAPIRDTTYRDTTARPGVRYVYAVVAVDTAEPPNRSAPSATVEEAAR